MQKLLGLLLFFGLTALLWAQDLQIYLNNLPFKGLYFSEYGTVFLETDALKSLLPAKNFTLSQGATALRLNGIPFSSFRKRKLSGKIYTFVSARELSEICRGKYEYNPESKILDIYTFPSRSLADSAPKHFLSNPLDFPALVQDVSEVMAKKLGLSAGKLKIKIIFMPPEQLKKEAGAELLGLVKTLEKNQQLIECTVLIPEGLSTPCTVYALAHEFAHIWYNLYSKEPPGALELKTEGFAEWVAFKLLAEFNYPADNINKCRPRHPIYSTGREYFAGLEKKYGQAKVLEMVEGKFKP